MGGKIHVDFFETSDEVGKGFDFEHFDSVSGNKGKPFRSSLYDSVKNREMLGKIRNKNEKNTKDLLVG